MSKLASSKWSGNSSQFGPNCPERCTELLSQLFSPTNHRFAGVGRDNLHAETGEANRQLPGSARAIEDVSVRRQETE